MTTTTTMTTKFKDGHLSYDHSRNWIQGKNHSVYTTIDQKLKMKLQKVSKDQDRSVASQVREIVRKEVYEIDY